MLALAVIVFPEVPEAAFIVSIVIAASVGVMVVGHVARPAGMQIIAYAAVVRLLARSRPQHAKPLAGLAAALLLLASGRLAHAELQVRLPTVEYRELEYEHNGLFTFDKDRSLGGQQSYTNSIGYGVTPWWEVELEGESNSIPDSSVHYTATTMENTFQITEPGQYMLNLGFFAEYLSVGPARRTQQLHLRPDHPEGAVRCPGRG